MKAIVQDRYGSADVLDFRDVARPEFGPTDVLVKVVAAGVDLGAWHFMTGQPYLMRILGFGLRAPRTRVPGTNVAGRVEAVGRDVAGFQPGEQVYGTCRGAYAEYARVRQDKLAPIPTGLSFEQAAVAPYACFAALQALRDHGKVQPDQQVLVVGASGAVGILYRKEIAAADDPDAKRAELMTEYEDTLCNPYLAAERGYIDAVIEPAQTRAEVVKALRLLKTKRETLPPKKHGNIPL